MTTPLLVGQGPTDLVLDPVVPASLVVVLRLGYVGRWSICLGNVGGGLITGVTWAHSIAGVQYGPESASIGAIAPGGARDLGSYGAPMGEIRLTFTIAALTTVRISLAGA